MTVKPYTRRVYYYETDKMGIVHHSNYIRWFEEARVDLIEQAGLPFQYVEDEGIMTPVLSAECNYKIPFKFGDAFTIKAYLPDFGSRAVFTVTYEVTDEQGVIHATGKTTHCFVDMDMKPVRIKKTHPHVYDTYMQMHESGETLYK